MSFGDDFVPLSQSSNSSQQRNRHYSPTTFPSPPRISSPPRYSEEVLNRDLSPNSQLRRRIDDQTRTESRLRDYIALAESSLRQTVRRRQYLENELRNIERFHIGRRQPRRSRFQSRSYVDRSPSPLPPRIEYDNLRQRSRSRSSHRSRSRVPNRYREYTPEREESEILATRRQPIDRNIQISGSQLIECGTSSCILTRTRDRHKECNICYTNDNLYMTRCNHPLCDSCWSKFFKAWTQTNDLNCPYCREKLLNRQINEELAITQLIQID
jgi:hypothetical protein